MVASFILFYYSISAPRPFSRLPFLSLIHHQQRRRRRSTSLHGAQVFHFKSPSAATVDDGPSNLENRTAAAAKNRMWKSHTIVFIITLVNATANTRPTV